MLKLVRGANREITAAGALCTAIVFAAYRPDELRRFDCDSVYSVRTTPRRRFLAVFLWIYDGNYCLSSARRSHHVVYLETNLRCITDGVVSVRKNLYSYLPNVPAPHLLCFPFCGNKIMFSLLGTITIMYWNWSFREKKNAFFIQMQHAYGILCSFYRFCRAITKYWRSIKYSRIHAQTRNGSGPKF